MRFSLPSRDWLRPCTARGRIIGLICIIAFLPVGCTPPGGENSGGQTQVTSYDTESLPAGEIIYSGSPEDARLAFIDLPEGTWEYFGRRDTDGTPIAIDMAQFTRGDLVTEFMFSSPGSISKITTRNITTGESTAVRITSLGGDQYQLEMYEPANADTPSASQVVTIPASAFGSTAKLRHEGNENGDSEYAQLAKSVLMNQPGQMSNTAKPIATPTNEARATFRIQIKTQFDSPVTDATVNFSLTSRTFDKLPIIPATHIGGGTYEGSATLARAAALGQLIKECEAQVTLGTLTATCVVGIIAFLGGGSEAILATVAGKLAMGGAVTTAALAVANKYEIHGPCAIVNDYWNSNLDQNLMVTAHITQCASFPHAVGMILPVNEVPVTPVATAGTGAGTIWDLAPVIVQKPYELTAFDGEYNLVYREGVSGTHCATIKNGKVTRVRCDDSFQVVNAEPFTVNDQVGVAPHVTFRFGGHAPDSSNIFGFTWTIGTSSGTNDLLGVETNSLGAYGLGIILTRR